MNRALLEGIVALALEAGAAVLRVYDDPAAAAARRKPDGSDVTDADEAAEAIILAGLERLAPGVPAVAEEAASAGCTPAVGARFFLVDPLDGTREFLNRNGEFTVNIALVEDGEPVLGAIVAPALGELWAGEVGVGAGASRVDGDRPGAWRAIGVRTPSSAGLDVLASRSHLTLRTRAWAERLKVRRWAQLGSSLKYCRIAEGSADLYPRLGPTMAWDTAAGHAILRAAGGDVRRLDGEPLTYGGPNFRNPDIVAFGGFDPFAEEFRPRS